MKDLHDLWKYGMSKKDENHLYMKRAIKAMRISEDDDPKLAGFIWQVFGYESKLDKEPFLEKI